MVTVLEKVRETILDILFPALCLACGKTLEGAEKAAFICRACVAAIPVSVTLTCPRCGSRLAENIKTCHQDTPFRLAAASRYDDPRVKKLIWELKYGRKVGAAYPIASIIETHLGHLTVNLANYLLVPMPLHPSRERERGFNQSEIIAKRLAERTNLKLASGALTRVKRTLPQAEAKNREDRRVNVAGSFAVVKPELISGKNILLLDDVFTSGATMGEAARTLRAAGAKRIIATVAARA